MKGSAKKRKAEKRESQARSIAAPGRRETVIVCEDESRIPSTGKTAHVLETRTYMLSAKVEDGLVQFYFKERPSTPNWDGDGALVIRIPNPCHIRLVLDPEIQWSFRHDFGAPDPSNEDDYCNDAVTLGPCLGISPGTYCNLRHVSDREVVFSAVKKLPFTTITLPFWPFVIELPAQRDHFNIYVRLDQFVASKVPGRKMLDNTQLLIKIDPDIQNPGDDTQGGGQKSLVSYLKDSIQSLEQILKYIEDK